jgi:hypothetical protein
MCRLYTAHDLRHATFQVAYTRASRAGRRVWCSRVYRLCVISAKNDVVRCDQATISSCVHRLKFGHVNAET